MLQILTSPTLTRIAVLAAWTITCTVLAGDSSAQRKRSSWRDRSALEHLIYKADQTFKTEAKKGDGIYSVYLPKSYDDPKRKDKRYPVVYFLHGLNEDQNRFHSRGGAEVLDKLTGAGTLPEWIFVCVFDGSRRSFYVDSDRSKVETMIVRDLVRHVDKTYRTQPNRESRAILGVSMGGFGALKIAFKHPDVFGAVATHSAAILPEKYQDLGEMFPWASRSRLATAIFGDPVDEKKWAAENPLCLAESIEADTLRRLKVYFDCGDKDRYGLEATNLRLHKVLEKRKIPHTWSLVKGGSHGWNTRRSEVGYNNANLPNSLAFLARALAQKAAVKGLSGALGGKKEPPQAKPPKK